MAYSTPSKLPADAYKLMPSGNIRKLRIIGRHHRMTGKFLDSTSLSHWNVDLYETFEAAVSAAEDKLKTRKARHASAAKNIQKYEANLQIAKAVLHGI